MGSKPSADKLVKPLSPVRSKPRRAPVSTRFSSRRFEAQIQLRTPTAASVSRSELAGSSLTRETCTIPWATPENADTAASAAFGQPAGYLVSLRRHLKIWDGGPITI